MFRKIRKKKLDSFKSILSGRHNMLIVLQDFPDPDAIAAASALKEIANTIGNVQCSVACGGVLGRAENRMLVRYLDLNLLSTDQVMLADFDVVAMVDTQPGTGNNSLPVDVIPDIVIDHHPIRRATRSSAFYDIRSKYGSTSTILYEYVVSFGLTPDTKLTTALLYGIRSDTNDLGAESIQADIDASIALYPAANKKMLGRIQTERLPKEYFQMLTLGLQNARSYGPCVVSSIGSINNPDMIGEIADLLLRNEESSWALCYGIYGKKMLLSLRALDTKYDAGRVMHKLVYKYGTGGGHNVMAGGQIPLPSATPESIRRLERHIIKKFLKLTNAPRDKWERLVSL